MDPVPDERGTTVEVVARHRAALVLPEVLLDFSKFKVHDWLIIGGAIGMLIFGLHGLDEVSASRRDPQRSHRQRFDFFFTGAIPWLLIIVSAVITVLLVLGRPDPNQLPWPLLIMARHRPRGRSCS